MIAVVLKGLAGRKLRALLTAFAVVIGVSMVSGTFILTDTTQQAGLALDDGSTGTTDAAIFEKELVKGSASASGVTVPASLLAEVRDVPGVAAAAGHVMPQKQTNVADIIGRDGTPAATQSIGRGFDPATLPLSPVNAGAYGPLELETGDWPKGRRQVVIDRRTAAAERYAIGDSVVIRTLGTERTFEVAGTVSYIAEDLPPRPSFAGWDIKTAQSLLDRAGQYDAISVDAAPGTSGAELARRIKPLLPADLQVKDTVSSVKQAEADWARSMSTIRAFLLGFGGIALLVGAFVIFNALSITVAQRTRELATLRTLGASRKQVMRSVVLEGLVLGLVASAIGLVFGYGIAKGMMVLFDALGLELPKGSAVVQSRTVLVSLMVGTVTTLLASILPARRATRVAPIAAVREGARLPASKLAERSHQTGLGVMAAGLAATLLGVFGGVTGLGLAALLGSGVLGVFVGLAMLAPRLVKPMARVIGWPSRRVGGVAGDLAVANAVRNPGRTASTAAALTIGLTLVTVVAVLGSGLRAGTERSVTGQVHADYVVDGKQGMPYKAAEGDALAKVDGVEKISHVRSDAAIVQGHEETITGIDPATIGDFYRFRWIAGSDATLARLGADGALVTEEYAKARHLAVGGRVPVTTPSGDKHTLVVRGIYAAPDEKPMLGSISIGQEGFDEAYANPRNSLTFLDADDGSAAAIRSTVAGFGDARVHTTDEYAKDASKDMATFLAMLYALLGFSVIVSLFGMINTLVLSVFERTREIGMLRTTGMTRRQARRMIRHESLITALIGAALGLGLGSALAALAIAKGHLPLAIPFQTLAGFTLVAVLLGIGAAVMPARRASKLDVLESLHYE
jgi:putative ABC transport system permease protein